MKRKLSFEEMESHDTNAIIKRKDSVQLTKETRFDFIREQFSRGEKELNLSGTSPFFKLKQGKQIGDEGAKLLSECLKVNKTIQHINLSCEYYRK